MRAAAGLCVLLSPLLLASCGNRFFTATLSGYVRQAGAAAGSLGPGINAAEVRIYLEEPDGDNLEDYLCKTSTMTTGGQDGYWSHKIMWEEWFPRFPDEGDSGTVWVWVRRPGYFPVVIRAGGILSDATNVLPTIEMEEIALSSLRGRVLNRFGQGIDGVRMALRLDGVDGEAPISYANTATGDDGPGFFEFQDLGWVDPDSVPPADASQAAFRRRSIAADGTASVAASLYLDDPAWYGEAYTEESPRSLTLASGGILDLSSSAAPEDRIVALSADFERGILEGRVVDASGSGLNGVAVSLDLLSTGEGADATARSLFMAEKPAGQQDGWYRFSALQWRDRSPERPAADAYGDLEELKLYVDDPDWGSDRDAEDPLVLSLPSDPEGQAETAYAVPEAVVAWRASFLAPLVEGRVTDSGGAGLNGIRLVLDLASSPAAEDAVFITRDIGGLAGRFQFTDLAWRDSTPEDPETEAAALRIAEGDWESLDRGISLTDGVSLSGGTAISLSAVRRTVWSFSAVLSGRILLRSADGSVIQALGGIPVSLSDAGNGALLSASIPSGGLETQTGTDGGYSFSISWTRAADYVPAGPGGGDSFLVDLVIGTDGDPATTDPAGFSGMELRSWENPSRAADRFFVLP